MKHNFLANVSATDLQPWLLHVHCMNFQTQELKAEVLATKCSVNCLAYSTQRIVTAAYFQCTLYCSSKFCAPQPQLSNLFSFVLWAVLLEKKRGSYTVKGSMVQMLNILHN